MQYGGGGVAAAQSAAGLPPENAQYGSMRAVVGLGFFGMFGGLRLRFCRLAGLVTEK